ncbi:MAG: phenylalanine--tRNA ligase subunit alpha [Acidisphaera sp.]|nr:phenylalanine--tRNA ligase subunit alpha [Acidisphaera sp.]
MIAVGEQQTYLTRLEHQLKELQTREYLGLKDDPELSLILLIDGLKRFLSSIPQFRSYWLGKKSQFSNLSGGLKGLDSSERKNFGQDLNWFKQTVESELAGIQQRAERLEIEFRLLSERLDVTLPPRPSPIGLIHPISRTIEEITAIFGAMDFVVGEGLDIQTDWYNFGALNIPAHHPARADHDTFYLPGERDGRPLLLRTQTSDAQIITMLNQKPPLRVIAPGRTYRADHDATHSPMFHQCEGLAIDRALTLGHLKGCLIDFLRSFFGIANLPVRFRASYFPFTEPSMEVDIGWNRRTGELGGGGDWLEILGSGMVHARVLANCGLDAREWQGFAFGMGVERLTMLKHGIPDLRLFFESDLRWLRHYGCNPLAPVMLHEAP